MAVDPMPRPPSQQIVPGWLVNLGALGWRVLVSAALFVVALYVAVLLGTVTASAIIAVIIAAAFTPTVMGLRARGWSKGKAAITVTMGVLAGVTLAIVLVLVAFIPSFVNVVSGVQAGIDRVAAALVDVGIAPDLAASLAGDSERAVDLLAGAAGAVATSVSTVVTVGILAGFLTFFLLLDGDKAWNWASQGISGSRRAPFAAAAGAALARVGGYLRGMALISTGVAIYDFLILTILGVPLAGPLAVIAFLGGFIPYFGGLVAQTIILLVTAATTDWTTTLIVLILFVIANVVRGDVVGPRIYGKRLRIHPAVVLIAVPAGAAAAGVVGMFAAVPLVAVVHAVGSALAAAFEPEEEPPLPEIVPGWLDRLAQWSWRVLVAVALGALVLAIIQLVPVIVLPVTIGVIVAATFAPVVDALVARGWRRGLASVVTVAGVALGTVAILALTVVALVRDGSDIVAATSDGASTASDAAGGNLGGLVQLVSENGGQLLAVLGNIAGGLASLTIALILGCLLGFYLVRDGRLVDAAIRRRFPDERGREISAVGAHSIGVLSGYMVATGLLSAFGAVTQFLIMVVLGLPLALPLAVLSFIGGFVPYIGSFITTGIAFLVTVAVGSTTDILIMGLFTVIFNVLAGSIIGPIVYGRAVNLHPAIVMVAIPAGAAVAGIIGMFMAVPVIAIVAAAWRPVLRVIAMRAIPAAAPGQPLVEALATGPAAVEAAMEMQPAPATE